MKDGQFLLLLGNGWLLFGLLAEAPHQQWFAALLALAFGGPGLVLLERSYQRPSRLGPVPGDDPAGGNVTAAEGASGAFPDIGPLDRDVIN